MQSTTTAAGHRKNHHGRGDSATSNSVYQGASVGAISAANDSTKPNAHGDPSSSSDDDNPVVIAMKKGMEDRYVSRGPGSEPVKGAPRRPTGSSRRDRHHQLPPGSSSRGSKIPPKGHTPATTATQPTTAGSAKRRPS